MIVVDTNIVVYFVLGADSDKSAKSAELAKKDGVWLLPGLWRHEYLSALSNYLRNGLLNEGQATDLWYEGISFFEGSERPIDQVRALENSKRYGISAYDAQFLTLAEMSQAPLVTEDKKLRRAAPDLTRSMAEILK